MFSSSFGYFFSVANGSVSYFDYVSCLSLFIYLSLDLCCSLSDRGQALFCGTSTGVSRLFKVSFFNLALSSVLSYSICKTFLNSSFFLSVFIQKLMYCITLRSRSFIIIYCILFSFDLNNTIFSSVLSFQKISSSKSTRYPGILHSARVFHVFSLSHSLLDSVLIHCVATCTNVSSSPLPSQYSHLIIGPSGSTYFMLCPSLTMFSWTFTMFRMS